VQTLFDSRQTDWLKIVQRVQNEWTSLVESERFWIVTKIEQLSRLQQELHSLVAAADGEDVCRDCCGGCCGDGLYHPTLVTILAHLVPDRPLPTPDFRQSCPYFGVGGCLFLPAVRPFNCVIFICEKIEERCSEKSLALICGLESQIRTIYEAFDSRFAGSSLRGVMNRASIVDPRDFLVGKSRQRVTNMESEKMELNFKKNSPEIEGRISELMEMVGVHHPRIIREMILSALKAGHDIDYLADLKLIRTTMKEMRFTNKVFGPYRDRRKVTIFGSARNDPGEAIYKKCVRFSALLAERGYMAITGGGGGIMQAGNEGAGAQNSFAVNIRLPFEQDTNPFMSESARVIVYQYFFNRKVAFLKEADAVALFPGGFGTLDEAMEALTLVQTGKNPPIPLVLIDNDEGDYWEKWLTFLKETLLPKGLISGEDFSLFTITRDPEEAAQEIDDFYRVYHSGRYVDGTLVLRLNKSLDSAQLQVLTNEFSEILVPGSHFRMSGPLPKEEDQPDLMHLPRIVFEFNRRHCGLLIAFIRRINSF
jgi:hypothetical protein